MPHGHGSSLGESKCVHECVGSFASALGRTGQSAAAGCRQLARLPQESQRTVLFAPILEPWQCPLCRDTGKSERCKSQAASLFAPHAAPCLQTPPCRRVDALSSRSPPPARHIHCEKRSCATPEREQYPLLLHAAHTSGQTDAGRLRASVYRHSI